MSDIHALSGAYAVDALDDLERAAFERHLAGCADCRAEVASLQEAAGLIAETTTAEPPRELRDRVLAGVTSIRPLPPEAPSAQLPRHRARRVRRVLVAAAAVVVLLAAGVAVWQRPWSDDTSQSQLSALDQVLQARDAQRTSLALPGGGEATIVRSDALGRAAIVTTDMPAPPAGRAYQAWLDQPGRGMVSAGLMPVNQPFLLEGDAGTADGAGITVEPDGGSPKPTTEPIALFDFGQSGA
jgi:anti-sigma-K factor RskA